MKQPDAHPVSRIADQVLDALPVGVAIFDSQQRAVLINPAYCESLSMPPGSFPPGTELEPMLQATAVRGVFGPGNPKVLVRRMLSADRSRPQRLRRRFFNGRSYDLHSAPLPGGGHVVCAVETTALLAARDAAETESGRIAAAIATVRTGIAAFGPDQKLLVFNPRAAALTGLPHVEMQQGMHYREVLERMRRLEEYSGPENQAAIAAEMARDWTKPAAQTWVRSNGMVIEMHSDPLPDGGWAVTINDITPIARAKYENRRRAELLTSILENIPHGVCVYGPDRRVALVNRAHRALLAGAEAEPGDLLEAVIRRRASQGEYGQGADPEAITAGILREMARPSQRRRRRPNGTVLDIQTAPLPDGGFVSVVTDLTTLTETEQELTRNGAKMEAMLANIRHGITLWDADKRLVAWNPVFAELLGAPAGVLQVGRPESDILRELLAIGEFGAGESAEARVRAIGNIDRSTPETHQRLARSGRMLEVRSDPTPDGGFVITFTDVTEARAAEIELRKAKEAAEAASLAKSRFLAAMSHELRTPLNAVIGFSDALAAETTRADRERVAEYARAINESGRKLLGMINNVLDVTRLDSGGADKALPLIDVSLLADSCLWQARSAAAEAGVTLSIAIDQPLPRVRGDETSLFRAVNQLLSNAVKFSPRGGSAVLRASLEGESLSIQVEDDGIGIPEADRERVFDPFIQLDSDLARRYPGAGLGLHVARALVQAHDGSLFLRERPGGGTIAEIRLPPSRLAWPSRSLNEARS